MFKLRNFYFVVALGIALLALGMPSLRRVQANYARKPTRIVQMSLTSADGRLAKARATEGSAVKVRKDGNTIIFTPIVRDESNGVVEFVISRPSLNRGSAPEEMERVKVSRKSAKAISATSGFSIKVERIDEAREAIPQSSVHRSPNQPAVFSLASHLTTAASTVADVCCVSCPDGFTACANCSVWIGGCGSCTAGDCEDGDPWWDYGFQS